MRSKHILLHECQLKAASEQSVRRLARYCEIENWDSLPMPALIEELGWKGYMNFTVPRGGWY